MHDLYEDFSDKVRETPEGMNIFCDLSSRNLPKTL